MAALAWAGRSRAAEAPSQVFDLRAWKLQIPGPKEVRQLDGYASDYFSLNAEKEMCFRLDAAEKGTTPNTHYVRSELRHEANWKVDETRVLSAALRVQSTLDPDKLTVLQIHGMTGEGDNAPPLLRVAVQKGDLVAAVKTSASGKKTAFIPLKPGVGTGVFRVTVTVQGGRLKVAVDGQEKLERDVSFWKFENYFKAGCYPQALKGRAEVAIRELSVK